MRHTREVFEEVVERSRHSLGGLRLQPGLPDDNGGHSDDSEHHGGVV